MSQQQKFPQRLLLLAFSTTLFFASCKKETDSLAEGKAQQTTAAFAVNPTTTLCKATSFKIAAILPHAAVVSITQDSLYDIQYDATGKPKSAKSQDWFKRLYNNTFEYDANNNLIYVKEFSGNLVNRYQKLSYPAGSKNSLANKITVTTYLRTAGILKEVGKKDHYFNATGKLTSAQQLPAGGNSIYYHVYNNAGNLQFIKLGTNNGSPVHTFSSYDDAPNVFKQHRVWQLLSGNFSNNNPLSATSSWHDVATQQVRPVNITYHYTKNAYNQIDKVLVTNKYQQANNTFMTEVMPWQQIWKNSCENGPSQY